MTNASWPTLSIPPVAVPAWHRLSAALTDASPPCAVEPALWFSTDGDDIETARHRCHGCHAIGPCAAYATVANEPVGVWAGVDRTRRQRDRRAAVFGDGTPTTLAISDHPSPTPETNGEKP